MHQRWLIVGLGNPGSAYTGTPHNIGFASVDFLANYYAQHFSTHAMSGGLDTWDVRWQQHNLVHYATLDIGGSLATPHLCTLYFAKPQTYMNRSGQGVGYMMQKYRIPSECCIVMADNVEQLPYKWRLTLGGGNKGHNGLKNITATIGERFWRLFIGVGRPQNPDQPLHAHVLDAQWGPLHDFSATFIDIAQTIYAQHIAKKLQK